MKKFLSWVNSIYRFSCGFSKMQEFVWNDLKKFFTDRNFKFGLYESEKLIKTVFEISKDIFLTYYYRIADSKIFLSALIVEKYDEELSSDIFILASHFNNILNFGKVIVNPSTQQVNYILEDNIILNCMYPMAIINQFDSHFKTSLDVYQCFQRLIVDHEAPTIIIADMLSRNAEEEN